MFLFFSKGKPHAGLYLCIINMGYDLEESLIHTLRMMSESIRNLIFILLQNMEILITVSFYQVK